MVFVGGMIRGLLVSDPAVLGSRPTRDVDVILNVADLLEFSEAERQLRERGFHADPDENAPICRLLLRSDTPGTDDVPVDFMPLDPVVLGSPTFGIQTPISPRSRSPCTLRCSNIDRGFDSGAIYQILQAKFHESKFSVSE